MASLVPWCRECFGQHHLGWCRPTHSLGLTSTALGRVQPTSSVNGEAVMGRDLPEVGGTVGEACRQSALRTLYLFLFSGEQQPLTSWDKWPWVALCVLD